MLERRLIEVEGTVQGVGFRPFVHRLASASALRGFVRNDAGRVLIDVEGEAEGVDAFCLALTVCPPPLTAISSIHVVAAPLASYHDFQIAPSRLPQPLTAARRGADAVDVALDAIAGGARSAIPPDVATCDACLGELFDPTNRRHRHAFITCTDCGPRLTIAGEAPFDRARTSMATFPRCRDCEREYHDPLDRRFHAEAIACPACGPQLTSWPMTLSPGGPDGAAGPSDTRAASDVRMARDPIAAAATVVRGGGIVALKALGGFHLTCDASDERAVRRLRQRKQRAGKPFAIMVRDVDVVRALCEMSDVEMAALVSEARPIVLLRRRAHAPVATSVAPATTTLGVMLPSTPLHHLLLEAVNTPLVMTSGNRGGEPVAINDLEARNALCDVADFVVTHNRDIVARCDDSVVRVIDGASRVVRRSRGFVPRALTMPVHTQHSVLAFGGELKNTICVTRGASAFLSAHVGDMDGELSQHAVRDAIARMRSVAGVTPSVIAHDLHPDYASTRMAERYASEHAATRRVIVQHHHAHVSACTAEYGIREPVIGVAFDGAGLGSDGATWGGEFLVVTGARFVRAGHLAYVPLPGGDAAARKPWRVALAHLLAAGVDEDRIRRQRPASVPMAEWALVHQVALQCAPMHRTSSVGRLFDAVASLLGVCHDARFEGEAAMALESAANGARARSYPSTLGRGAPWTVNPASIVYGVLHDLERGRDRADIAASFHASLRDLIVLGCERVREETGLATVVLTGGVFMNRLLTESASAALTSRLFRVFTPQTVPCNDGGLALGQAHVAAHALENERCA